MDFTAVTFSIELYTGISMQLSTGVEGQVAVRLAPSPKVAEQLSH